jgi:hypothetical protein
MTTPSRSHPPAPPSSGRKVLVLVLICLPVAIVVALLYAGLHDREATPKWRKKPPAETTNSPSTNPPAVLVPTDRKAQPE